jgi:Tfp pilus assembly protein PilZ
MQPFDEDTNERRSNVRIKVVIRVSYGVNQSKLLTGDSVDLSAGGIFLTTTCPFDVDDNVKLNFFLLGQEENAVSCDARVAWINHDDRPVKAEYPTGAGLQFIGLAPEDLHQIELLLKGAAT